jgi:hypothetical protein
VKNPRVRGAQGKLVVEALLGRRKAKRDFEYEVKWWGMPSDPRHNKWIMKVECAPGPCARSVRMSLRVRGRSACSM